MLTFICLKSLSSSLSVFSPVKRSFYNDFMLTHNSFAISEFNNSFTHYYKYLEKGRNPFPVNFESTHSDGSIWKKFDTGWECIKRAPHITHDNLKEILTESIPPFKNTKINSIIREQKARILLEQTFPENQGYIIKSEIYLRDSNGKKTIDLITGTGRRIDFAVVHDDVIKLVEVTSKTAYKKTQQKKEQRIRENGGTFIKVHGKLYDVSKIQTELLRME